MTALAEEMSVKVTVAIFSDTQIDRLLLYCGSINNHLLSDKKIGDAPETP
jgi:hypothetical protein